LRSTIRVIAALGVERGIRDLFADLAQGKSGVAYVDARAYVHAVGSM
jgi:hypothetical protein